MKDITISMDGELYRQASIKAAEQATSINALFMNFIVSLTDNGTKESEFQRLQREEEELRDELHDRHALR